MGIEGWRSCHSWRRSSLSPHTAWTGGLCGPVGASTGGPEYSPPYAKYKLTGGPQIGHCAAYRRQFNGSDKWCSHDGEDSTAEKCTRDMSSRKEGGQQEVTATAPPVTPIEKEKNPPPIPVCANVFSGRIQRAPVVVNRVLRPCTTLGGWKGTTWDRPDDGHDTKLRINPAVFGGTTGTRRPKTTIAQTRTSKTHAAIASPAGLELTARQSFNVKDTAVSSTTESAARKYDSIIIDWTARINSQQTRRFKPRDTIFPISPVGRNVVGVCHLKVPEMGSHHYDPPSLHNPASSHRVVW